MPTYEYECTSCGNSFEVFQSMSEEPLSACPSCGERIRRVINGGTGIIFKGSGFYVNDSRKIQGTGTSGSCEGCGSAPSCPAPKKETA